MEGVEPVVPDPELEPAPSPSAESPDAVVDVTPAPRRRLGPIPLPRRPGWLRLPRTKRGIFALLLVLGGLGGMSLFGTMQVLAWTETADFCGRCHTMRPELTAYELGPHRDLACGECHVEPGVMGWVKAKINGTRQLAEIVLGTFPQPIPPPDHEALPSVKDTCLKCHSLERLQTAKLVTRTQYTEDVSNTRQFIGLMVRPGGGDVFDVDRSVHWHVLSDVEYRSPDERAQKIDWVGVTDKDGAFREYIAQEKINLSSGVNPDLEAIKATENPRKMDCMDCHNRVGHPIPNPRKNVDYELSTGKLDASLPWLKREAMRILWAGYPSEQAADTEIDRLDEFYRLNYPEIYPQKQVSIQRAVDELKVLYRLTATPEMKVSAATYPDNLGHTDFVGCFRCHDGGHYLVENGGVGTKIIPSTCDTCHTFPQIGPAVASLPLGQPPTTHSDRLWVFDHKSQVTSLDPGGTTCGQCHAKDYCVNCHSTGAVTVDHQEMLTNHAETIRTSGAGACAYCHQPVYCARCHTDDVMPGSSRLHAGPPPATEGVSFPLIPLVVKP